MIVCRRDGSGMRKPSYSYDELSNNNNINPTIIYTTTEFSNGVGDIGVGQRHLLNVDVSINDASISKVFSI